MVLAVVRVQHLERCNQGHLAPCICRYNQDDQTLWERRKKKKTQPSTAASVRAALPTPATISERLPRLYLNGVWHFVRTGAFARYCCTTWFHCNNLALQGQGTRTTCIATRGNVTRGLHGRLAVNVPTPTPLNPTEPQGVREQMRR